MSIQQFVLNKTLNLFNYYTSKYIPENVDIYNTLDPLTIYICSEKYILLFLDKDIINIPDQNVKSIYGVIQMEDWIKFPWQIQNKISTDLNFAKVYLTAYNISKYFDLTQIKIIDDDNFVVGSKICKIWKS